MTTYLITGASGQLGQLAVDHLAKRVDPGAIIALVRSDEQAAAFASKGIATRRGDYNDPASLEAAFAGVDRLALISGSDLMNREAHHKAVVDAAMAAGVGFLAYTSLLKADNSPLALAADHKATEEMIAASGLLHSILRNGWYSENVLMTLAQDTATGQRYGASGTGKYAFAPRNDYAEALAVVLAGGHDGKVLELAGDEGLTLSDYAQIVSEVSGKPVSYIDLPEEAFKGGMMEHGLPEPLAAFLANSEAGAAQGGLFDDSQTLSTLLGRPTEPLRSTVQKALAG